MKLNSLARMFVLIMVIIVGHMCEKLFWSRFAFSKKLKQHKEEYENQSSEPDLIQNKFKKIAGVLYSRVSAARFLKDFFSGRY